MGIYVNPPADGFAEILNYKEYIDKSEMIAYTNRVLGTPDKLTCFSRPRRFGKSFAAKMVTAYYSKGADARELFAKLKLAKMEADPNVKERSGYEEHLNRHDVISIDMTPFVSLAENTDQIVRDLQIEIKEEIDTGTFQNDLTSLSSRDDIFTLLVHLGYLAYDFVNREVFIPNEEVRGEFVRAVKGSRRTAFNWIELQCKERKAYLQDRAV